MVEGVLYVQLEENARKLLSGPLADGGSCLGATVHLFSSFCGRKEK